MEGFVLFLQKGLHGMHHPNRGMAKNFGVDWEHWNKKTWPLQNLSCCTKTINFYTEVYQIFFFFTKRSSSSMNSGLMQFSFFWFRPQASACAFGWAKLGFMQIWPNVHIWARQIWSSGVSLRRSCKMQFRYVDLRSIGPPSQKLWPNFICARFPHCNYNGGAISKGRRHIWQNAFSDISFYWPKDQESILGNMNFQKGWLAIAKLKPLVDRYSCQPIRSPDTSNNLSVGPSCMWRTWN